MITIHFYLKYHTHIGEQIFVTGNVPELGDGDFSQALPLEYLNDEHWHGSVVIKSDEPIVYRYLLRGVDGFDTREGKSHRVITPASIKMKEVQVMDVWNYAGDFENAFYSQPFLQTLLQHPDPKTFTTSAKKPTHSFRVKAPLLGPTETICISGSDPLLGSWDTTKPVLMHLENHWYTIDLNLSESHFPIGYKYGIWDTATHQFTQFESGPNRTVHGTGKHQFTVLHDGFAAFPNNSFRGAGVAIPVFSLRSEKSAGVGEFNDIKLLVDWGKKAGLKLIQLLPINDTTANHNWQDSYPYAAISAFALHPQYLNIETVAGRKHASLISDFKESRQHLNSLDVVDYEPMMAAKWNAMKSLFPVMKKSWLGKKGYKDFFMANKHWLLPYATFCYLRDKHKTPDFSQWPGHNRYDEAEALKMIDDSFGEVDDVLLHVFIQYHLHLQLREAVTYAHENGLVMKGDIPIGIYRNSCDAWQNPELYNMDEQAGAPPDDFAVKGQNWGFPTYNWQQMQEDGFSWWKQRFEQMGHYFDAFRIDHILGFFRIWSVPMQSIEGIMGRFVPCIPVYQVEFQEKGIYFEYDRYCKPFINDGVLWEFFGHDAGAIKNTFLDDLGWGRYALKPEFDTQHKIEDWFKQQQGFSNEIKFKLFDLVSNVILFDDLQNPHPERAGYHFKIDMLNTSTFRYLDEHLQYQLKELYYNYFYRRQDEFWRKEALQKLPALKASTNMLICGEDLGMVPDCVPGVMKDLGLLSLEIQRMPKDPKKQFFHPADAPYLSVVTPSTHDMSTIRGWWEEDRHTTQQFYQTQLGHYDAAPEDCSPGICLEIINQHVYSPAMWSIFQLQDMMSIDGNLRRKNPHEERINVPANPKHYWQYRMHITLEDLNKKEDFNQTWKELLQASARI